MALEVKGPDPMLDPLDEYDTLDGIPDTINNRAAILAQRTGIGLTYVTTILVASDRLDDEIATLAGGRE